MNRATLVIAFSLFACVTSGDEPSPALGPPATGFELYRVPLGTSAVCFEREPVHTTRPSLLTGEAVEVLSCYVALANADETHIAVGPHWCGDDEDCMRATPDAAECPLDRPHRLEYLAADQRSFVADADHAIFSCDWSD
ncbi:MAG TPA: hypothetical protein VIV11_12690 [Kofleriaceae bacterium]